MTIKRRNISIGICFIRYVRFLDVDVDVDDGGIMKKILKGLFAAVFTSTVLFTAWPQSASMKNGTYTGTGNGKSGKITVQVTVKKNAIADIKVLSHKKTPGGLQRRMERAAAARPGAVLPILPTLAPRGNLPQRGGITRTRLGPIRSTRGGANPNPQV